MANERPHILHYRNGNGDNKPAANNVVHGEIAITYGNNCERLYIKNGSNVVVPISADHFIHDRIDEQDAKMSEVLGISTVVDSSDSTRKAYKYQPSNELLNECQTMNDSVETLADKLNDCMEMIQALKSNTYMIETNFNIASDTNFTQETISYNITNNGNTTVPKNVIITKSVNDAPEKTILSNENVATDSITSNVEGAKERFTLLVTPNLTGALQTRVEQTRYICYIGNSASNVTSADGLNYFQKTISNGQQMEMSVTTRNGDFIFICVPKPLNITLVTSEGLPVTMDMATQEVTTSLGRFTCYHTLKPLKANTWNLVIKHYL